jgi:hypothetical protein
MATTVIKTQIQFRRDTTENWYLNRHIVPAAGEPCFDIELGTLRIGDGVKSYEELDVIGGANIEVAADGASIVLEDGVFKLVGFDAAEVGAQPRKNAEGNIEWVLPSTETAEGLQSTVAGLQSDVKTLQDIVTPSGEGAQPLLTRVETLEGKADILNGNGYTDGSVLKIVKDEINAFATDINNNETVDTFKELVEYVANHNGEAATLAADILTLQELVGEDPVAEQIATAISNANGIETIKVGDTLIEAIDKVVTIPVGAGLKASEEVAIAEDGTLSVGTINVSKIVQAEDEVLVLDGGASV